MNDLKDLKSVLQIFLWPVYLLVNVLMLYKWLLGLPFAALWIEVPYTCTYQVYKVID